MARTIVLVRHGKAQRADVNAPDIERSLVPGGAEALAAAYPTTFALLGALEAPALLWVSPALRARQTAEQVASALEASGIAHTAAEARACLWEQDGFAFLAELANTPDDATVIAVGHIPFMEGALARLTGTDLAFKPGAVACVAASEGLGRSGKLLWFVQGPSLS